MIEIIERREQITATWLSNTLAAAGLQAKVLDVDVEPIIAGYYGTSSRLTPRYEKNDGTLPGSLFLKMATEHPSARAAAAEGGMYRYEVGFYRDLADQVDISTPRCFAAEISEDGATFVLLLEDAAPLKQSDQLEGLDLDQSRLALKELAGLHASTWQGKGMERCDWAQVDDAMASGYAEGFIGLKPAFEERFRSDLSSENLEILDRLAHQAQAYWRYTRACQNQVSVHCDFRADNMLFGQRHGELAMVTIDWVGTVSSSGRDVGHFLGTSLPPSLRKAHESDLLRTYHESLLGRGVTGFDLRECIDDYRINLFYPVFVVVTATASVDIDARGQKLFMSMFNRTCEAIRDTNALDLIESL